jgi:hypothetical protein
MINVLNAKTPTLEISIVGLTHSTVHNGFIIQIKSRFESPQRLVGTAREIIEMPADFAPMGCSLSFLGMRRNNP